ncbi:hypothetical protein ADA01nite_35780 [Aneurinibacillus danicus]|uniref:Zinc-ribbon domain-containing protein n=1 Tax=Aneurinibacillus danicus TaxID=267746 RepID=A0A511VDT5_9BACL|nr:hypothetical protein ADA01nite_35780 [Aneurinibacillus danicus]
MNGVSRRRRIGSYTFGLKAIYSPAILRKSGDRRVSDFKGYIGKYYTIWCGKCIKWEDVPVNSYPEKQARKMGWKNTKEYGWLCPDCIAGTTREWDLRK